DIVLVIYTPTTGSVAALKTIRDFLPDYVRVTPLEDQNRVTIFALVSDIEKYIELIDFFLTRSGKDPRTIERIKIHHIAPSEALSKLGQLMSLDGAGVVRASPRSARGRDSATLEGIPEPAVTIIPEDIQGFLLVRAMKGKIDEIKLLLPYIDVDTKSGRFRPVIIQVEHGVAADLIPTVQQILTATSSTALAAKSGSKRSTRSTRTVKTGAAFGAAAGSVALIAHPAENSIIVLASEEADVDEVREIVRILDVPRVVDWQNIPIHNGDAAKINEAVVTMIGVKSPEGASNDFHLFTGPDEESLWFQGTPQYLADVRELVALLDVPENPVTLHIERIIHQEPSFVVSMLEEFADASGSSSVSLATTPKGKKRRGGTRVRSVSVSKLTADDPGKRIFVLCNAKEWDEYLPLIKQLDQPTQEGELFTRLMVQNINAQTAIDNLGRMLTTIPSITSDVRLIATDEGILVIGATQPQIAKIKTFLAIVDKPSTIERRTFEILYADPAEIKSLIETFVAGKPAKPKSRRRSKPEGGKGVAGARATTAVESLLDDEMKIVQLGSQLIVEASRARLDEVALLIKDFDVEQTETEMRVYDDFPRGADIERIADTISSVLSGTPIAKRGGRRTKDAASGGASSDAPRFIPQPASGRLVVIAQPRVFVEVEKLLDVLRHEPPSIPYVVEFVEVKFLDPDDLIDLIEPILSIKVRGLLDSGELEDSVEGPVEAQRKRQRKAMGKDAGDNRYHIAADVANSRIVIAAPQIIVDQVRELVPLFDTPGAGKPPIFRTVELKNASPGEMIQAIKEMIGRKSPNRLGRSKRASKAGGKASKSKKETATGESLTIVEAPGGTAIVLMGLEADVEQAIEWIQYLDGIAEERQVIKVYNVEGTDVGTLFDLVVSIVDTPGKTAPKPRRPSVGRRGKKDEPDEFVTSRTHNGANLYIQADLIARTMLVATTPDRIVEIDAIIDVFIDPTTPSLWPETRSIPKFLYDLEYVDAFDASWDLEGVLVALWEPPDELPKVESAMFGSGNILIVRYPHEDRFDDIRELIRKYVDVRSPADMAIVRRSFSVPEGLTAEEAARRMKMNHPEIDIDLQHLAPEQEPDYGIERLRPPQNNGRGTGRGHPCAMPGAFRAGAQAILAAMTVQNESSVGGDGQAKRAKLKTKGKIKTKSKADALRAQQQTPDEQEPAATADDLIRNVAKPLTEAKNVGTADRDDRDAAAKQTRERTSSRKLHFGQELTLKYDSEKGIIVAEGPAGVVEDVPDWFDTLKEEISEIPTKPDIRIFRVRYIDVFTAQDIIEEMFNATRQQRQAAQRAQQLAQRAQQLAQRQQRGQRQGAQQGEEEQGGRGGRQQGRPGQQQQRPQPAAPQLPPTTVRVYPNPRDRTLILRAETSQYPQIRELLAIIDQPKPIDSFMRTYVLEKLNAAEVEEMLSEMLGLGKGTGRTRRRASRPGGGAGGGGGSAIGPGSQLPQTILQENVTGTNRLGIDPEDIKLFSSEAANTIMAMAPTAALDFIGELIGKLESGDIPDRLTRYYTLKHADVGEVVDYLIAYFDESLPGRARKRKSGDSGKSGGAGSANSPSFMAYARLNLMTVQATEVQLEEISEIVDRLDVDEGAGEWRHVKVSHADAKLVADTLSEMYGTKGGRRSASKRGGSGSAAEPKFIGDEGGGIVFFSAPANLHDKILNTVAELEEQYKDILGKPRVIVLKHGRPSVIAAAIEKAYDIKRGGKSGGKKTRRFTVTPHDASRRIFVMADETLFDEIASLAQTLDQPGEMPEFRIYPLEHVSAPAVHEQLTKLMADYMRQVASARGKTNSEPFSVQVDETANALIVLGGPTVFGFLEENLRKIDNPAYGGKDNVHVVEVKHADPASLARILTEIYVRGGKKKGGSSIAIAALDGSQALLIKSNPKDFERIAETIAELDAPDVSTGGEVRVVTLLYADSAEILAAMQEYLRKSGGGRGRGRELAGGVRISAMKQSNAIMIAGDLEELDRLEGIIDTMDIAGEKGSIPQIIPIQYANAGMLVATLKEMFTEAKGSRGRNYAPPIIVADESSNALIVRAAPADLASILGLIKSIDTEDKKDQTPFKIIKLAAGINVADLADMVQSTINDTAKARAGSGKRGSTVPKISATPDLRTNTITLSGHGSLFADAEAMIHALEEMGPAGGKTTRIVTINRIAVDEVERLIEQLTQQSSGQRRTTRRSSGNRSQPRRRGSGRRP
ncbi:MAG: hypothetical protein IID35_02480, partial [Planctomycetes bacterium]|nr:hypothetical protein [Planctomycetota bacterium]